MFKNLLISTAVSAFLLTSASAIAAPALFSNIKVETEASAVGTERALEFWPTMSEDIRAAIAKSIFELTAEDGYEVHVSIREVGINADATDGAFKNINQLSATVSVWDKDQSAPISSFPIDLSALPSAMETNESIIVIQPADDDLYHALIEALAESVKKHLVEMTM